MVRYALLAVVVLIGGCVKREPAPDTGTMPPPLAAEPAPPPAELSVGYLTVDNRYCIYHPATGISQEIFTDVEGWVCHSADGARMAYLRAGGEICLADLTTGESTVLAQVDDSDALSLTISPDGTKVAWVASSQVRVWQEGNEVAVTGPTNPAWPSWSPDSGRLAFGAWAGEDEASDDGLWLWEGSGEARRLIPPAEGWGSVGRIHWSPDGKWLAWERGAGDGWVGDMARSDGSELRREEIAAGPRQWLPDSSGLVVDVHIEADAFSTGLYRLADRKLAPLGPQDADTTSCLSADGSEIMVFGPGAEARMIDLAAPETSARWDAPGTVEACAWGQNDMIVFAASASGAEPAKLYLSPPMGPATDLGLEPCIPFDGLRWLRLGP